jgi:filamentous hemagglutinin
MLLGIPQPAYADNCGSLSDCYGVAIAAAIAGVAIPILISLLLDFSPFGRAKGILEAILGRDLITGDKLAWWERLLNLLPGGKTANKTAKSSNVIDTFKKLLRDERGAINFSRLRSGEGTVGRFGDLLKAGSRGDNLTPHHIPSNAYMKAKVPGYTRNEGIAINMDHPHPGTGGRHRQTESYGKAPNLDLSPRQVLAREVWDARSIYRQDGLYTQDIKRSLQQVIEQNKASWPGIFNKK